MGPRSGEIWKISIRSSVIQKSYMIITGLYKVGQVMDYYWSVGLGYMIKNQLSADYG